MANPPLLQASRDDIILNDMVNDRPIELSKITIGLGEDRQEFLQYELEDKNIVDDEDPNEVLDRPTRYFSKMSHCQAF